LGKQEKSSKSYANVILLGKLQETAGKRTVFHSLFTAVDNFFGGKNRWKGFFGLGQAGGRFFQWAKKNFSKKKFFEQSGPMVYLNTLGAEEVNFAVRLGLA